jgi:hypothetical protein
VAENKEVPDSNIGVPPVRKYVNYRTLVRQICNSESYGNLFDGTGYKTNPEVGY